MSDAIAFIILIIITITVGFVAGSQRTGDAYKAQAVERGYAQYCPTDGAWAWVGECGK